MYLGDWSGKRRENLKSLVGDVEVGLESSFETSEGGVGETADHSFVVDVGLDVVDCDVFVAEIKPPEEGAVDIETREMAESFDLGSRGILELVHGMACNGWAVRE